MLETAIKNFYDNSSLNITFKDIIGSKSYNVKGEKNMMFGELIVNFYIVSGLTFEENLSFFFNNIEIAPYSIMTLKEINVQRNSQIFFMRKNQIMMGEKINIVFYFDEGQKCTVQANPNMLFNELILILCQKVRCLYKEFSSKYSFLFNSQSILGGHTLKSLGIVNGSLIKVHSKCY